MKSMIAKLISAEGERVDEFFLPSKAPTPKVICDNRTGVVYLLGQTGNGFEYNAVSHMLIALETDHILVDDEGGVYE